MGLLTRYVLLEVLKLLAISLLALTVLLSVGMAAREAVRAGMPAMVVMQAMPYFVVEMLGYAMPAAILYSVCSVFGRIASDNEFVAFKSLGVNPLWVAAPVLVLAHVLSLATLLTYDLAAVWGRPGIRRLILENTAEVARGALKAQGTVNLPWGSISVRDVRGSVLIEPCVDLHQTSRLPQTLLTANRGKLHSTATGVHFVLYDAQGSSRSDEQTVVVHPGRLVLDFPIGDASRPFHRDWLATHEIAARLGELQAKRKCAVADFKSPHLRVAAEKEIAGLDWRLNRLRAEPHRRWANGFSCLAFAVIGVPIGMWLRNTDSISTFFVAFVPVLVLFYPLLMVSENLATSGVFPPAFFWLADIALASGGALLLWRVTRR